MPLEIVVTSTQDHEQEALEAGASRFIPKKDRQALFSFFATLGSSKVVFVEDDSVTLKFLPQLLGMYAPDTQSESYASAEEFIEAHREDTSPGFDVIVTDVSLGGMTGIALVEWLRQKFPSEESPQV